MTHGPLTQKWGVSWLTCSHCFVKHSLAPWRDVEPETPSQEDCRSLGGSQELQLIPRLQRAIPPEEMALGGGL